MWVIYKIKVDQNQNKIFPKFLRFKKVKNKQKNNQKTIYYHKILPIANKMKIVIQLILLILTATQ